MNRVLANPELIRNQRAQLRPGRMLVTAIICGIVSIVVGYSTAFGFDFLAAALGAQVLVLLIGGGVACLHAIQREKDTNTFDFQRLTRLTPLELAIGKLLGAPVTTYFIALCLLPAALVGATVWGADPSHVLAAYAVLLLGCLCFHAFALLVSMLIGRAATAAVLIFLAVITVSSWGRLLLDIGSLSPFVAVELVGQRAWDVATLSTQRAGMVDVLFGWPVNHFFVLVVLYVSCTVWFLLPVVCNLKRDPSIYELYTPAQALGFALYVNLIAVAFFRWRDQSPLDAQALMLSMNTTLFAILGLVLLRNRDRVRRLHLAGRAGPTWMTAVWPAPYLLAGSLIVGLAVVPIARALGRPDGPWDAGLAVFRAVFLSAWLVRDVVYLQWMNLRRGRRPVVMAVLYLMVFYGCVTVAATALHLPGTPLGAALHGVLFPGSVFTLSPVGWGFGRELWLPALGVQLLVAGCFASLQRRALAGV